MSQESAAFAKRHKGENEVDAFKIVNKDNEIEKCPGCGCSDFINEETEVYCGRCGDFYKSFVEIEEK